MELFKIVERDMKVEDLPQEHIDYVTNKLHDRSTYLNKTEHLGIDKSNHNYVIIAKSTNELIYDKNMYLKDNRLFKASFEDDFADLGYSKCRGRLIEEYPEFEDKYSERFWIFTGENVPDIVVCDTGNCYYDFINYLDRYELEGEK